ncbi:hypothetical protein ANCDUO_13115, partial [Ancylostoma duodenale]
MFGLEQSQDHRGGVRLRVDDAYLMMHSWMRVSVEEPTMTKRERVAHMLVDVGPSVTITSLTNFLAFLVGIYTPTPEIQLFCMGNSVAILFDFIYQITMYAALLSITGDLQMRKASKAPNNPQWLKMKKEMFSDILDEYSQWLASKFTAVFLFIVLCVYWSISVFGATQIEVILSADKLVLQDSPLITTSITPLYVCTTDRKKGSRVVFKGVQRMNHLREKFVLVNYTVANIFIQN